MKLQDVVLSEISQSQKGKYCIIPLEVPRVVQLIETESRMVAAKNWEKREIRCCYGYRISVYKSKKI